jgi:hypothetical protein
MLEFGIKMKKKRAFTPVLPLLASGGRPLPAYLSM